MNAYIPQLIFVCPPIIYAHWHSEIGNLFNGNNLAIRVDPDRYTQLNNQDNDTKILDFFDAYGVDNSPVRRGFNVKVNQGNDALYLALRELASLSKSPDTLTYNPIVVYDYCRPDSHLDYQRGYAIRRGVLNVGAAGGIVKRGVLKCDGTEQPQLGGFNRGFTIRFEEIVKTIGV